MTIPARTVYRPEYTLDAVESRVRVLRGYAEGMRSKAALAAIKDAVERLDDALRAVRLDRALEGVVDATRD